MDFTKYYWIRKELTDTLFKLVKGILNYGKFHKSVRF